MPSAPTYLRPPSLRCSPYLLSCLQTCKSFWGKQKKDREEKLEAENQELRTRVAEAEAAHDSLRALVVDALAANAPALRGLPSPEARGGACKP